MANGMDSHLKIASSDLQALIQWPDLVMQQSKWTPTKRVARSGSGQLVIRAVPPQEQMTDTQSLLKIASEVSGNSPIINPEINVVLSTIRDGMCVGLYLAQEYEKRSNLDVLRQQNNAKTLGTAQQPEFAAKVTANSAIAIFGASAYISHIMSGYAVDKTSAIKPDFVGIPDLSFKTPQTALMSLVYHFAVYCGEGLRVVNNSLDMVKIAQLYFEAAMNEIHQKEASFSFVEPFTSVSYKLESSDFVVKGFTPILHTVTIGAEFRKVSFNDIVGNRRAKHQSRRTAMMLCCYDLEMQRNPYLELGNFPLVRLGFGVAGTGKSLQIAATATLCQELADKLDIPFLFHPMPSAIISTFQGGSGERMESWMRRINDADKLVYAPIDDAENNLMNRTREGVSAGVREVISVFLTMTEGASAIVRGNSIVDLATNLPEIIDPAVLSRVQARYPIDGARTVNDFLDQGYLWWRKFNKIDAKFVAMGHKSRYVWLSDQKELKNLTELEVQTGAYRLKDQKIAAVVEGVRKKFADDDHSFFAELFFGVQKVYPTFSSRDVRNIQSAVDGRILDFDLPSEWFDDPKLFYKLPYDQKVELLKEELRKNMKGLSFAQIMLEESLRYVDTISEILNTDFERQVAATVARMEINTAAQQRFTQKQ